MATDDNSGGLSGSQQTAGIAIDRRTLVVATGGMLGGTALLGQPIVAQETVVVNVSDETAGPGEQVAVSLTIEGDNIEVTGYDFTIVYDADLLSFVEANGIDMPDPEVSGESAGAVSANAIVPGGVAVDLTAAEFVFAVDDGADPGAVADITVASGEISDTDAKQVSFTTDDGSVTNSDGGSDDGDDGSDGGDDGSDGGGDDGSDGGDDGGDDGNDGGEDGSDDGSSNEGSDDGSDSSGDDGSDGSDDESEGDNSDPDDGTNESDDEDDSSDPDSNPDDEDDSGNPDSNPDDEGNSDDSENNPDDTSESGSDNPNDDSDNSDDDAGDDGFGPGFSVGGTLTALGGVGYLLQRRLTGENDET